MGCDGFWPLPNAIETVGPVLAPIVVSTPSYAFVGWLVLSAVVVYLALDLFIYWRFHVSMSRWLLNHSRESAWFRWLGVALLAFAGWHWFFGLPGHSLGRLRGWFHRAIRPVPEAGAP